MAYFLPAIEEVTDFYVDNLGFRESNWREGSAMFLRCSPDHHTINFFKGKKRLAHLAFEVKDFSELVRASDLLIRNNFPLDWGPARHTIGHNCACYHTNPDGTRTEIYAEMDQMKDEELGYFDPRPWHEDRPQRPRNWVTENSPRNKWELPAFLSPVGLTFNARSLYINPAPGTRRAFGVGEFMTGSSRSSDGFDPRRRRLLFPVLASRHAGSAPEGITPEFLSHTA